ncbi:hypothetical protein STSO111631_02325 [Stackebrandtia soli]
MVLGDGITGTQRFRSPTRPDTEPSNARSVNLH